MRIVPVIDLKGGCVVRGVAGRRDEYRPIQSNLVAGSDPAAVAAAFAEMGFREVYVADLDAIAGGEPDFAAYDQIERQGLTLLLDAGAGSLQRTASLLGGKDGDCRVVLGLESLSSPSALAEIVSSFGPSHLVFSLDLMSGIPKTTSDCWRNMQPLEIATHAWDVGLRRMIVLDIAHVGTNRGPATAELCRDLRQKLGPELHLISGGGVRGLDDLRTFFACGCDAALVASALHDGRIAKPELLQIAACDGMQTE